MQLLSSSVQVAAAKSFDPTLHPTTYPSLLTATSLATPGVTKLTAGIIIVSTLVAILCTLVAYFTLGYHMYELSKRNRVYKYDNTLRHVINDYDNEKYGNDSNNYDNNDNNNDGGNEDYSQSKKEENERSPLILSDLHTLSDDLHTL